MESSVNLGCSDAEEDNLSINDAELDDGDLEFLDEDDDPSEEQNLKKNNLLEKYGALDLEGYASGYTASIQKAIKENSRFLFHGSVDDVFLQKNKKYIKISSSLYDEVSGIIEIDDKWEDFFINTEYDDNQSFFDPFYFIISLVKAEKKISKLEGDSENSISDSVLLHGKLLDVEKVLV